MLLSQQINKTPLWFWYEDLGPWPTPRNWGFAAALIQRHTNATPRTMDELSLLMSLLGITNIKCDPRDFVGIPRRK